MTPCPCGEAHAPRATYYVTAIDGARTAIVCGPYPTHAEALAEVDAARDAVMAIDMRAWWWSWGTCGTDDETLSARWDSVTSISA